VTLAVTGNTISSRVFRRYRVTVFQRHRLPLTGSRWDIRLVSYSGKTPTFCVFPVFSVAVMEKCCDACGDGEYYFRSGFSALQVTVFQRHRLPLTGSRWDIRLVSYSGKTPTFCVFPVFSVAVMEKCCDACGDGEYYFRSSFRRYRVTVFQRHRLPLTGSRRDIRLVSYSGKTPTFCVFPVFSVAVMEKCCDACGDGEYYFRSGFSALQGDGVSEASTAVDRSRRDIRWVS
jgi:nitrate reductase NapE component